MSVPGIGTARCPPAVTPRLASTEKCDNQAFALGSNLLGLQFQLDVPRHAVERWLIGYVDSLSARGIGPGDLRRAAAASGRASVEYWLHGISQRLGFLCRWAFS